MNKRKCVISIHNHIIHVSLLYKARGLGSQAPVSRDKKNLGFPVYIGHAKLDCEKSTVCRLILQQVDQKALLPLQYTKESE